MEKLFYEYNINSDLKKISQNLGYLKPSEIQQEVLDQILDKDDNSNNKNYLLTSIAGSGKTFAFLMCVLNSFNFNLKKLQAIILLPTRELALQTVSYLDKIGDGGIQINYKLLVGGCDPINSNKNTFIANNSTNMLNNSINSINANSDTCRKSKSGGSINKFSSLDSFNDIQIIVGTLGKMQSTFSKSNLSNLKNKFFENLKFIVIDEADKIIQQNKDKTFDKFLNIFYNKEGVEKLNKNKKKKKRNLETNISLISKTPPNCILVSASFDQKALNFYKNYLGDIKVLQRKLKTESNNNTNGNNSITITSETNLITNTEENKFINNYIKEYYYIFKPEVKMTYFEQKYQKLFEILNSLSKNFKQCLVFYNQKGRGEELASDLRESGWATTFIHADLTQDQRILIYEKIRNVEVKIILATDLFSRGIDLSTVDLVVNFDSPFNSTEYFHRVGRTGRYNSYGVSISFFQENENKILEEIKLRDLKHNCNSQKAIEIEKDELKSFIEIFRNDLDYIQKVNLISFDLQEKVRKLEENENNFKFINSDAKANANANANENENFPIDVEDDTIDKIQTQNQTQNFMNKKRRRDQYNKESLVSEWVDVHEELFDSSNFKYLDEEHIDIHNNITDNIDNCNTNNNKFCLYCNFLKIFEKSSP